MRGKTEADFDGHVALRLRALRNAAGMSQQDVGKILGVTFQQVQKIEKGRNRVGAGRLVLMAKMFGVGIAALFNGIDPKTEKVMAEKVDGLDAFLNNRKAMTLIAAFGELNEENRLLLIQIATKLADT